MAAFEGHNQTETGICPTENNSNAQCTLGLTDLQTFATNPNLPGEQKNIVVDPRIPTAISSCSAPTPNAEVTAVSGLGTLLYGLAVSSTGRVFITQTDARNNVNGIVARGQSPGRQRRRQGEPEGSREPDVLATRSARRPARSAAVRRRRSRISRPAARRRPRRSRRPTAWRSPQTTATLVVTAMGSSRVFTRERHHAWRSARASTSVRSGTATSASRCRAAWRSSPPVGGAPQTAYVLNSFENTVSVVDVSNPDRIAETTRFAVGNDPTPRGGAARPHRVQQRLRVEQRHLLVRKLPSRRATRTS